MAGVYNSGSIKRVIGDTVTVLFDHVCVCC